MGNKQNDEIDLGEIFLTIKSKIFLIIAVGLLCGCAASVYTKAFVTPTYTSVSTMFVLTKETTLTSLADLQLGTQLTKDYTVLINSRPVLQKVVDNLNLDMDYKSLRSTITITNPTDTRILEMSVTNPDPQQAKAIADELAYVSSEYIGDKMEVIPPKIIEEGEVPTTRTTPNLTSVLKKSVLLGMALCTAIIVVLELLNDTIKTEEDLEKYLELPTLAVLPYRGDSNHSDDYKKSKRKKWHK